MGRAGGRVRVHAAEGGGAEGGGGGGFRDRGLRSGCDRVLGKEVLGPMGWYQCW